MALLIPPGFAQVSIYMALTGDPDPMICTIGIDISDAAGDFQACAKVVEYAWANTGTLPGPRTEQAPDYTTTVIKLAVGQDGGPPIIVEEPVNVAGTGSAGTMPQNCAVLVRKNTNLGGREGRGRMYVPGLRETDVSPAGAITGAVVTAWQTKFNNFFNNLVNPPPGTGVTSDPSCPPVILHTVPQLGLTPPPTPIVGFTVDPVIATQRRRLRR